MRLYHARGYDAVIVTDHYTEEYFDGGSLRSLPWPRRIDCFLEGYRRAHREGERVGLQVFLGLEVRLPGSPNDYLMYGIGEQPLKQAPPLYSLGLAGVRSLAQRCDGIVVQAHPFRSPCSPADPSLLDGVEIFNGNPRQPQRNDLAGAFARRHDLLQLSGSDTHWEEDVGRGGMRLPDPIGSLQGWMGAIRQAQLLSSPDAA